MRPHPAAVTLAYALYDAAHTSRLGEQDTYTQNEYITLALKVLYTLDYRPESELQVLAKYISDIKDH